MLIDKGDNKSTCASYWKPRTIQQYKQCIPLIILVQSTERYTALALTPHFILPTLLLLHCIPLQQRKQYSPIYCFLHSQMTLRRHGMTITIAVCVQLHHTHWGHQQIRQNYKRNDGDSLQINRLSHLPNAQHPTPSETASTNNKRAAAETTAYNTTV